MIGWVSYMMFLLEKYDFNLFIYSSSSFLTSDNINYNYIIHIILVYKITREKTELNKTISKKLKWNAKSWFNGAMLGYTNFQCQTLLLVSQYLIYL